MLGDLYLVCYLLWGFSPRVVFNYEFLLPFFFWPHHMACGILVPQPWIEPMASALEVRSLNHWATREVQHVT